ncbi:MAG: SMI1/KNR4 family protein [Polyangiaceae bacterium]
MDSDLAEAVSALKGAFDQRKISVRFGNADPQEIERLRKTIKVPARFRSFLAEADPLDVETVTPVERVRFIPSPKLLDEQLGYALPPREGTPAPSPDGAPAPPSNWRKSWIIVARSALLGDPYFLDISKLDAEGDCPVFTAMTGTDTLKPTLCASSVQQFLRILATAMEVASGFGEAVLDDDDERTFREALAPKIKIIDSAALRAGHWT